ncbi:MAG: kelch repeat-containing protein [Ginsengibacter sp.]
MKDHLCKLTLRIALVLFAGTMFYNTSAQWVRKKNAIKSRSELAQTVVYNSKIYCFMGFDSSRNTIPSSEVYDPSTDTWKSLASIPSSASMTHQGTLLIDNTVWHIGGRLGKNPGPLTSAIWIYNISTNTWSRGPDVIDPATGKTLPIAGSGVVLLGRVIHIFGGFTPTACTNDQDKYHLTLDVDTWLANRSLPAQWKNNLKPMPLKRNHVSGVVLGGKIYAFGGQLDHDCGSATEITYCHVYNPSTNSWAKLPSLPSARSHAEGSTFAVDGKIYMVGGQGSNGGSTDKVAIFDPAGNYGAGKWVENTTLTLPYVNEGLSATILGSKFIIHHGGRGTSKYPQKATYSRTVTRMPVYKLGFPSECLSFTTTTGKVVKGNTWLFTIDGSKSYTTSSNAKWLTVNKNASGTATQNAVDIGITVNASGLSPGTYTGTITATGISGGTTYSSATLCVKLTIQSSTFSVTNIKATSGRTYALSTLRIDTTVYTDRTYQVTHVPSNLNGALFIKTPNADKYNSSSQLLSFSINQPAIVYIAYDPRGTTLPSWLSGWQKFAGTVGINDPKIDHMNLYYKEYVAGVVTLGGNLQSPAAGALDNYFVIFVPVANTSLQRAVYVVSKDNTLERNTTKQITSDERVSFNVFPNPNNGGKIFIKGANFLRHDTINVLMKDMYGNTIKSVIMKTDDKGMLNNSIEINNVIPKGSYVIKAISGTGIIQQKLIIN